MNAIIVGNGNLARAFENYALTSNEFNVLDFIDEKNQVGEYENVDAVIDFSSPDAILISLNLAMKYHVPLIIGTTGYNTLQVDLIKEYSKENIICIDANYSRGFNILKKINAYIDSLNLSNSKYVIETHQKYKKDNPSGSSKLLCNNNENIFSLRGGASCGEHQIRILLENEELILTHKINSRFAFVEGVIKAFEFVKNKENGLYSCDDFWENLHK